MEVNRGYFAVIPANVRYDRNLPPNAKLLYGEITALCNEKGFCWATNKYFAELYGVSVQSVSKWISKLAEQGYINIDLNYKEGTKEILNRYLRIVEYPIKEKFNTPIKEKFKENNTVINNTSNNICANDIEDFFEVLWKEYPKKKGKGQVSFTQKRKLYKLGQEQMLRTILRYKNDIKKNKTADKYVKNGSTFFNSGYVDYLDENYEGADAKTYGVETI